MGVVYLAQQEMPRRTVALKVIRPGMINDRMLQRFEHEAQVLGRLQHPGIAQVFEAGQIENVAGGAPQAFVAMEYVDGLPLMTSVAQRSLPVRARLELF